MNTQRYSLIAAVVGSLLAIGAPTADAQWNVARTDSSRTSVYATYGLDPAFVTTVGVARRMAWLGEAQLSAEAGWVVAKPDARDFRGRVGARAQVLRWGALRLMGDGAVIARGTSNSIYRALGFGASSNWTLGVYRPRWFAGTEAGFDKSVATRITNSDWYRTYFDPDAKDGWYGNTGGTIHYGMTGGLSIARIELMTRAGLLRTERFNAVVPPFYASVGLGFKVD